MWHSYFYQIQLKYSMRVSLKNPLVIRLDGKNATKGRRNDFINNHPGTFLYALEESAKYFSKKYNCISIFGSDEISFIFPNPSLLINDLDKEHFNHTNEIIALFSQYFFDYFSSLYTQEKIFWHGKCFSIDKSKVCSYLRFRSNIISNVMSTFYLIKHNDYHGHGRLKSRIKQCQSHSDFNTLSNTLYGILYSNGNRISLEDYYNGDEKVISEQVLVEEPVIDLLDFD